MYQYYEMAFFGVINGAKELYFPYRSFSENSIVCYSELDGHSAASPEYAVENKQHFISIDDLTDDHKQFLEQYIVQHGLTSIVIIDPEELTLEYLAMTAFILKYTRSVEA